MVLTSDELDFFRENGFVLLREAISATEVDSMLQNICMELRQDLQDRISWEDDEPCFVAPREVRVRPLNSDRLLSAARQLVGFDCQLADDGGCPVLIYPESDACEFEPFNFHVDGLPDSVSLWPDRRCLIALMLLTNTARTGGATAVSPSGHKLIHETWSRSPDEIEKGHAKIPDLTYPSMIPVPGNAGDAVLMHYLLPHGHSRNASDNVRVGVNFPIFAKDLADAKDVNFRRSPSFLGTR